MVLMAAQTRFMKSFLKGMWIWRQNLSLPLGSLCPPEVFISLHQICKQGITICCCRYYSICTSLFSTGEKFSTA